MTEETRSRRKKPKKNVGLEPDNFPEPERPPAEAAKKKPAKDNFYAGSFTRGEAEELDTIIQARLDDEIGLLRVAMRRCCEAASSLEPADIEGWVKALASLGMASTRLAGLLRSQAELNAGGNDTLLSSISSALASVRKEMKL